MVKSGLDEKIVENREVPRVSAYRLAAHLGSAFIIYSLMFITGLNILTAGRSISATTMTAMKQLTSQPAFRRLNTGAHLTAMMVFYTALSGAFVAGLDAGLIYNTFPLMADRWIPTDLMAMEPLWKNIFENPATVQFNHRILVS
jgi:cytochrome c oxidase assembly protein subunit 15